MKQIFVVILASVYFSAVCAELLGEQLIRYCVQCTSGPLFFAIKSEGEVTCESYPPLKKVQYVHYILHPSDCELEFVQDYYTKDNLTHVQGFILFILLNIYFFLSNNIFTKKIH